MLVEASPEQAPEASSPHRLKIAGFGRHWRLVNRAILIAAAAWALAAAAYAQTPDLARATQALAANWRPIAASDLGSAAALQSACAGAVEEIAAVDAMLPTQIDATGLARVRALRGLVVVPSGEPGSAFFFAPRELVWFSSGLGSITVLDEAQGRLALRDASGAAIRLQLGRVGGRSVLRVQPPQGAIITMLGCAPTSGGTAPSTAP